MKQKNFLLRYFWNNETPVSLMQCFIAGILHFAFLVIAMYIGYTIAGYFASQPRSGFPWEMIAIFFPLTFLKPFFMWYKHKSA